MPDTDVLIAGAGPTGLVLALWLSHCGVRVRIVDKEAQPGTTSRALVVHARTLELYRQIGLADAVVDRGLPFADVNLWVKARRVAHVHLGAIGKGISPFSYMIIFPQDEHERLLIERLHERGIDVERPVELTTFDARDDRVVADLRSTDGREEICEAKYLAGCDGAHSTVRDALAVGFPGSTYMHRFYVADVDATGPIVNSELHVALDYAEFVAAFPLRGDGHVRLIGIVHDEAAKKLETLGWGDVSREVIDQLGVNVTRVNWFSTYHVHHRVVSHFRRGRAFVVGDAAHIHSPVGGQGMNTGIGDAINLSWKLAAVLHSSAKEPILDTYESERIAFARRLVATTDRAFQLVTSDSNLARFVRLQIVPRLLPPLFASQTMRRFMFRTISQTSIDYRGSALSDGTASGVRAGDRLPWIEVNGGADNFSPLASLDWQAHVYGDAPPAVTALCRSRGFALHVFSWTDAMRAAGFERNAVYFVRPDGYIGFTDAGADPNRLERYIDAWSLRARPPAAD